MIIELLGGPRDGEQFLTASPSMVTELYLPTREGEITGRYTYQGVCRVKQGTVVALYRWREPNAPRC